MSRPAFALPRSLVAAALALPSWRCAQPPLADASLSDAASDESCSAQPGQGWVCYANRDTPPSTLCAGNLVCGPSQCPAGCTACQGDPSTASYGIGCVADPAADARVSCPGRVCAAVDCQPGCRACAQLYICVAVTQPDGGRASCPTDVLCSTAECPPGCQVLT